MSDKNPNTTTTNSPREGWQSQTDGVFSIPDGWVETTLGEVVVIKSEKLKISNINLNNYISTENLLPDRLGVQKSASLPNVPSVNAFKIGDTLFSNIRTYFKKVWFARFDGGCSNDVLVFTPKDERRLDKKFLYYLISSDYFINFTVISAKGTKMPRGDKEAMKSFTLNLPTLPEQQAIASVLSTFDDKIELLRDQNKTLEQLGQTIFNEWFGKYGVDDELPEGWQVGKITEVIKREPVSYKCDKKDLDSKGKTRIIDQGSNALYGYTSREPDFIASKENPVIIFTNHTCNYWFIDYPFCAIQNVLPYRGKDGFDEYFLYFMTKGSITFIEYKGHWPDFEAKDFVIPPIEVAQNFSKLSKPILEKISDNNSQIESLSKTRDELLPKLMSGATRVNL